MGNYLETIYFRDEHGEDQYPQKLCNYLYASEIEPKLGKASKDMRLLDIGSGKGNFIVGFSRLGFECFGLDKRKECIEALDKFTIKECNLEEESIPYDDDFFDVIFSKSVIEHVWNADNFLKETKRVLKPGGVAVLMAPDWNSSHEVFWDDYTHVKAWTRKSLQNALKMHGFEEVNSTLFRQLPILWKYPYLKFLADITSLLPHSLKWKDKNEEIFREWIRFSKEKMLLATATKK